MNSEKFRKLYIEFEKETLKLNPKKDKITNINDVILDLKENRKTPYYTEFEFIDFCRKFRNKLSHDNIYGKYLNCNDDMINKLEKIIYQIKHPITAYEKSIKTICYANIDDNVKEYMNKMIKKNYTHIPIYDNDKLIGIFSENSLFQYLFKDEIVEISEKTTFSDILDYISLENTKELIKFKSKKTLYDDIVLDFMNEFKKNQKLSCIMITPNGKPGEKVVGILTAWDIIK